MGDKLMSVAEVADFLGIAVNTLYQHRYRGSGPPGYRVGGRIRYRPEEIERWLEEQADKPKASA